MCYPHGPQLLEQVDEEGTSTDTHARCTKRKAEDSIDSDLINEKNPTEGESEATETNAEGKSEATETNAEGESEPTETNAEGESEPTEANIMNRSPCRGQRNEEDSVQVGVAEEVGTAEDDEVGNVN